MTYIAYSLLKDKQTKILIALKDNGNKLNISDIAKNTNVTYVHACNFILYCEKAGLVKSKRQGKDKYISLTQKGSKIADMLFGIYNILNGENINNSSE